MLGPKWQPVYEADAQCSSAHFEQAMLNIVRHPNINSTVLMRADILLEEAAKPDGSRQVIERNEGTTADHFDVEPLMHNIDDVEPRILDLGSDDRPFALDRIIVRRAIPRNPLRDWIVNQSCLLYRAASGDALAVVYIPHLSDRTVQPYYLPPSEAVAILYDGGVISTHYMPHESDDVASKDATDRGVRIALHLVQTAHKHAHGVMNGYTKRVEHDLVVPRVPFQDTYVRLKQKYAKTLVANWAEKTDPTKHVFEDIAIAAFLVVLWDQMYGENGAHNFEFVDVGCGNGLLVHLLLSEGFRGWGVDARARKSWATYPESTRRHLHERVIVPQVLVDSATKSSEPQVAAELKQIAASPSVETLALPENVFVIGNHADELTLWIPLLNRPFMVVPCCSYSLAGAKMRFPPRDEANKSTYAALVHKVEQLCARAGWVAEKEMLRIPSTRNAAVIGRKRAPDDHETPEAILAAEGGADGWVQRTMALQAKAPRDH